jgi:hypothetical protein
MKNIVEEILLRKKNCKHLFKKNKPLHNFKPPSMEQKNFFKKNYILCHHIKSLFLVGEKQPQNYMIDL